MKNSVGFTIFALLPLALFSPYLALFDQLSFAFFQDYFFASLSVSVFILVLYIVNNIKHGILKYSTLDLLVILYMAYTIFNLYALNNFEFKKASVFLLLQLFLYLTLKQYFLKDKITNLFGHKYFIVTILVINCIPIIIAVLEFAGIIPIFGREFIMTGGFFNQGQFANFLAILFPFSVVIVVFGKGLPRAIKIFAAIAALLTLVLIIVSFARSAWIACFVSAIFLMANHQKTNTFIRTFLNTRFKKVLFVSPLVILAFLSLALVYNIKKDSANGRIIIWENCIRMVKDKPLFGHGYNSFCNTYNCYQVSYFEQNPHNTPEGMLASESIFAFNDYLETSTEIGIAGLLLFLSFIIYALLIKKPDNKEKSGTDYLLTASKSVIIGAMVCSMFSYPLQHPTIFLLLLVVLAFISSNFSSNKFSISLNKKFQLSIGIIGFVFISFLFINQIRFFHYLYRWKTSFEKAQTIEVREAMVSYKKIAPFFNDYWPFLFNYGSILNQVKEYDEGIKVLEIARQQYITYDLLVNLGRYYEKTTQIKSAEKCYSDASNLIPHKLTPKYLLFKLYQNTDQPDKAHDIAKLINNTELKVYSDMGAGIKYEISNYLRDQDK